jgi:hypothetical protein
MFPSDGRDTRRWRHPSQTIWANAMESTELMVIRNTAAMVVLAYVLGLRESSVMSLSTRAQNITHKRQTKVFVKREASWHEVPATHKRKRVAYVQSRFNGSTVRLSH